MRFLMALIGALVFGVVVVLFARHDSGYVLLAHGDYRVETSLVVFLLFAALVFGLLYFTLRFLSRAWHAPGDVRRWRRQRDARHAQASLTRGLLELSEGNWDKAERYLLQHAEASGTPLLNYLAAARAAQLGGDSGRRDLHLQQAHRSLPSATVAVGLTQAELQLSQHQFEQALATLQHLHGVAPKHPHVLNMLQRLYQRLGEWEQLRGLLPELRRQKILADDEFQALELRVYRELMSQPGIGDDAQALSHFWKRVPKSLRREPVLLEDLTRRLLALGRGAEAEPMLRNVLAKHWNPRLVELYGLIAGKDVSAQLKIAEGWLNSRPDDPDLLLALARISRRNELWGKARSYFEASLANRPRADAYRELGELLDQLGESDAAADCYRKGLRLSTGGATPPVVAATPPTARIASPTALIGGISDTANGP